MVNYYYFNSIIKMTILYETMIQPFTSNNNATNNYDLILVTAFAIQR